MQPEPSHEASALLRQIKPVNQWLEMPYLQSLIETHGRIRVSALLRKTLHQQRESILQGGTLWAPQFTLQKLRANLVALNQSGLRRVINGTGILIHTGLGRSPLSQNAIAAVAETASGYCNLEIDLESGFRGRRADLIRETIQAITGAPAATLVNNNAAATILALRALAHGKQVLVSRGQLVEIGGGFRLPEIMAVSGSILREVGTTNKTRLSDYENAITPDTAAIMRIHTSNYTIVGFTEEPDPKELAALAHSRGIRFIDDIGSGALTADAVPAARSDPNVTDALASGADIVLFSGDKLLGGPQCGILVGNAHSIALVEKDPLMRAFRVDKMTIAALAATLESWTDPEIRNRDIPLWQRMSEPLESVKFRADQLADSLQKLGWNCWPEPSQAFAGGGSLPSEQIPSWAVVVAAPYLSDIKTEEQLGQRLRSGSPAILGRVHKSMMWLDLRTIPHRPLTHLTSQESLHQPKTGIEHFHARFACNSLVISQS